MARKLISSLLILIIGNLSVVAAKNCWKAGIAKSVITPKTSLWMAGYASRNHASEGKLHDLWVKILALEDAEGRRGVWVTSDLLGFPKPLSDRIRQRAGALFGLSKAQIILNSSHTHSGPVLPHALVDIYNIDPPMQEKLKEYEIQLENKIIALMEEAFKNLEPADIYMGNGTARFQVNRRNNREQIIHTLTELKGPNEYSVPVLKVVSHSSGIRAIVFGYACHPTVLSSYLFSGDYPGFAQLALEKTYPGVTAMFFQGAGADQNPIPRRSVPLAKQYGKTLAAAVERVLTEDMQQLSPILYMDYAEIELPLLPPLSEEGLKQMADSLTGYQQNWAKRMLAERPVLSSYPYPVQVWNMGNLPLIALGGEVVIEYAIGIKKRLGHEAFVMGYANDVMAYIPSDRILQEGGYEGADSQRVYGLPALWKEGIEGLIYKEIIRLAERVRLKTVTEKRMT